MMTDHELRSALERVGINCSAQDLPKYQKLAFEIVEHASWELSKEGSKINDINAAAPLFDASNVIRVRLLGLPEK